MQWLSKQLHVVSPALGAFILLAGLQTALADEAYYLKQGSSLQAVHGDPNEVEPAQWVAYFFRKGSARDTPARSWGTETANSAAELMEKVRNSQAFERRYEKWCGCSWGSDTFHNVLAPVAVFGTTRKSVLDAKAAGVLDKLHAVSDRLKDLVDTFNTAAALADGQKLPVMEGPVADFLRSMHKVMDQFLSIKKDLTQYSETALNALDSRLEKFNPGLNQLSLIATQANRAVQTKGTNVASERSRSPVDRTYSIEISMDVHGDGTYSVGVPNDLPGEPGQRFECIARFSSTEGDKAVACFRSRSDPYNVEALRACCPVALTRN